MLLSAAAVTLATQCDNGAVGVDACRRIEEQKCEALVGCPFVAIKDEGDVAACKLAYRDQCLFGIADAQSPDDVALEACLAAIRGASTCKLEFISDCDGAPPLFTGSDPAKTTGCDATYAPERLEACAFLRPPDGTGGAGGAAGAGGS
ncbi:MAG: hypothetical protein EXR75_12130 [Myxococcales bacterium]|nr:hypothetical protein [Myxococcales bacterium]